jgi:hypothetical protein
MYRSLSANEGLEQIARRSINHCVLPPGAGPGHLNMSVLIFPMTLVVLDVAASVVYALDGDWRRAVYWFAAAVLTTAITV